MQKWEYYLETLNIEGKKQPAIDYLNLLGKSGWELVSMAEVTDDDVPRFTFTFVFKRLIEPADQGEK